MTKSTELKLLLMAELMRYSPPLIAALTAICPPTPIGEAANRAADRARHRAGQHAVCKALKDILAFFGSLDGLCIL